MRETAYPIPGFKTFSSAQRPQKSASSAAASSLLPISSAARGGIGRAPSSLRRLQQDWQLSKIEASPRMEFGGRGSAGHGNLSDAALDAGKRVSKALAVLPRELRQLTELFLMPEDHPFSLERVAAIVKEDRRAAAYGIRIALSLLARHYGYAS